MLSKRSSSWRHHCNPAFSFAAKPLLAEPTHTVPSSIARLADGDDDLVPNPDDLVIDDETDASIATALLGGPLPSRPRPSWPTA